MLKTVHKQMEKIPMTVTNPRKWTAIPDGVRGWGEKDFEDALNLWVELGNPTTRSRFGPMSEMPMML